MDFPNERILRLPVRNKQTMQMGKPLGQLVRRKSGRRPHQFGLMLRGSPFRENEAGSKGAKEAKGNERWC